MSVTATRSSTAVVSGKTSTPTVARGQIDPVVRYPSTGENYPSTSLFPSPH